MRRLGRIQAALRLRQKLMRDEKGNFAGMRIENGPQFRVVARFKAAPAASLRRQLLATGLTNAPDIVAEQANVALSELTATQAQLAAVLSNAGVDAVVDINEDDNQVSIVVTDEVALRAALDKAGVLLPSFVNIVQVPALFQDRAYVTSGLRTEYPLNVCSTGFEIRETATGIIGFATAGHCENSGGVLTAVNPSTPKVSFGTARGERLTNGWDFQWHTISSQMLSPSVELYNGLYQPIKQYAPISSLVAGLAVTVVGGTTRRAIGAIIHSGVPVTLGSYGCCFYRIKPTNYEDYLISGGDSGGVVFSGGIAIGLLKAVTLDKANDAYFMPIETVVKGGYSIVAAP